MNYRKERVGERRGVGGNEGGKRNIKGGKRTKNIEEIFSYCLLVLY